MSDSFANKLKSWRVASRIKQATLAHLVGVTQGAVSRWERGLDTPSPGVFIRLREIMSDGHRDEAIAERLFTTRQAGLRNLFDFEGLKLLAASRGTAALRPIFASMVGRRFLPYLTDETGDLMNDEIFMADVRRGEVAVVTGVSVRHMTLKTEIDHVDRLHRWHARYRKNGPMILVDVVYDPCDPDTKPGVEEIIRLSDIEI